MGILFAGITVMLLVTGVVLGWSLALGALLALVLPFSLFQGTLLSMVASMMGLYIFFRMSETSELGWDDSTVNFHEIPRGRFFTTEDDWSYENWIRYEVANAILYEIKYRESPGQMDDEQLQALAMRLTDPAVAVLKRKTGRSTPLHVTVAQLRNQLKRMDQQPYDDDIMHAAVDGINLVLTAGPLEYAVRKKMWDQPAPIVVSD